MRRSLLLTVFFGTIAGVAVAQGQSVSELDADAASALAAAQEFRKGLKDPDNMYFQKATVTDKGAICLEVGVVIGAGAVGWAHVGKNSNGKWVDWGASCGVKHSRDVTEQVKKFLKAKEFQEGMAGMNLARGTLPLPKNSKSERRR